MESEEVQRETRIANLGHDGSNGERAGREEFEATVRSRVENAKRERRLLTAKKRQAALRRKKFGRAGGHLTELVGLETPRLRGQTEGRGTRVRFGTFAFLVSHSLLPVSSCLTVFTQKFLCFFLNRCVFWFTEWSVVLFFIRVH